METQEVKKLSGEGILFNKKVVLMPVIRAGGLVNDKKHIGYFMFDGAKVEFCAPLSGLKGGLVPFLKRNEQDFFEQELREDLSFNKRGDNFWHTFKVSVTKDNNFIEKGIEFDLSNVMDNLRWRLLKIQSIVAPSWEERYEDGAYRFALCDADFKEDLVLTKQDLNRKAYKILETYGKSTQKLYDFLCVYWMGTPKSKRPEPNASKDAYLAMMQDILENNTKRFVEIGEDKNFETRLFIHRAMTAGFIDRAGHAGNYTIDGKFLGKNIDDCIANILSPEYHEDYLRIKTLIVNNKVNTSDTTSTPTA